METTQPVNLFTKDAEIEWQEAGPGMKRKILAYDKKLMLVKVRFEKGAVGALHQHPHSQVSHVESGVFEVEIDTKKKVVAAGDTFYVPPDTLHGALCLEAGILLDIFSPMREDFIS